MVRRNHSIISSSTVSESWDTGLALPCPASGFQHDPPLVIGEAVEAYWVDGSWYGASILDIHDNGLYDVQWDADGSKTEGLTARQVRRVEQPQPLVEEEEGPGDDHAELAEAGGEEKATEEGGKAVPQKKESGEASPDASASPLPMSVSPSLVSTRQPSPPSSPKKLPGSLKKRREGSNTSEDLHVSVIEETESGSPGPLPPCPSLSPEGELSRQQTESPHSVHEHLESSSPPGPRSAPIADVASPPPSPPSSAPMDRAQDKTPSPPKMPTPPSPSIQDASALDVVMQSKLRLEQFAPESGPRAFAVPSPHRTPSHSSHSPDTRASPNSTSGKSNPIPDLILNSPVDCHITKKESPFAEVDSSVCAVEVLCGTLQATELSSPNSLLSPLDGKWQDSDGYEAWLERITQLYKHEGHVPDVGEIEMLMKKYKGRWRSLYSELSSAFIDERVLPASYRSRANSVAQLRRKRADSRRSDSPLSLSPRDSFSKSPASLSPSRRYVIALKSPKNKELLKQAAAELPLEREEEELDFTRERSRSLSKLDSFGKTRGSTGGFISASELDPVLGHMRMPSECSISTTVHARPAVANSSPAPSSRTTPQLSPRSTPPILPTTDLPQEARMAWVRCIEKLWNRMVQGGKKQSQRDPLLGKLLESYQGREEQLMQRLCAEHDLDLYDVWSLSPELVQSFKREPGQVTEDKWRERILLFYAHHNPSLSPFLERVLPTHNSFQALFHDLETAYSVRYTVSPSLPPLPIKSPSRGRTGSVGRDTHAPSPEAEDAWQIRLTTLFAKHDKKAIPTVESLLQEYQGNEVALWRKLLDRYKDPPDMYLWRDRIAAFLAKHAPSKLDSLDALLQAYKGKEDRLLLKLIAQHGPEPDVSFDVDRGPGMKARPPHLLLRTGSATSLSSIGDCRKSSIASSHSPLVRRTSSVISGMRLVHDEESRDSESIGRCARLRELSAFRSVDAVLPQALLGRGIFTTAAVVALGGAVAVWWCSMASSESSLLALFASAAGVHGVVSEETTVPADKLHHLITAWRAPRPPHASYRRMGLAMRTAYPSMPIDFSSFRRWVMGEFAVNEAILYSRSDPATAADSTFTQGNVVRVKTILGTSPPVRCYDVTRGSLTVPDVLPQYLVPYLGDRMLHYAVPRGDISAVRKALSISPEQVRDVVDGASMLHAAAASGNVAMVELLLSQGAVVRQKDREGRTAIDVARELGHTLVVDALHVAENTASLPQSIAAQLRQSEETAREDIASHEMGERDQISRKAVLARKVLDVVQHWVGAIERVLRTEARQREGIERDEGLLRTGRLEWFKSTMRALDVTQRRVRVIKEQREVGRALSTMRSVQAEIDAAVCRRECRARVRERNGLVKQAYQLLPSPADRFRSTPFSKSAKAPNRKSSPSPRRRASSSPSPPPVIDDDRSRNDDVAKWKELMEKSSRNDTPAKRVWEDVYTFLITLPEEAKKEAARRSASPPDRASILQAQAARNVGCVRSSPPKTRKAPQGQCPFSPPGAPARGAVPKKSQVAVPTTRCCFPAGVAPGSFSYVDPQQTFMDEG